LEKLNYYIPGGTILETSFWSSTKGAAAELYEFLFEKDWPSWLAGILIAVVCIFYVLWRNPWGVVAGYRNWGDWFFYPIGVFQKRPLSPLMHNFSLSNLGLLGGALASSLMARQFRVTRAPGIEYAKAVVGGILMGFGSVLAAGCNIGGFYIAIGTFSASGFAMMFGMIGGTYLGVKYLLWEVEKFPTLSSRPPAVKPGKTGINWAKVQPYIGAAIMILIVLLFYVYAEAGKTMLGGFLFLGMLIGLLLHRSRFCFVASFRDFFMTGEPKMLIAVGISTLVFAFGMAALKVLFIAEEDVGIYNRFWLGGLSGGLVFGFGMQLAGGCGSSTLWRSAEGNTKLWVSLIFFALSTSFFYQLLNDYGWLEKLGQAVYLPAVLTWEVTLPLYVLFFFLWIMIAIWNEKTQKFVIF
jgi:uncharacterized membrane protein YedE/YeeE